VGPRPVNEGAEIHGKASAPGWSLLFGHKPTILADKYQIETYGSREQGRRPTATLIIFAEKTLTDGHRIARPLGVVMVAAGVVFFGISLLGGTEQPEMEKVLGVALYVATRQSIHDAAAASAAAENEREAERDNAALKKDG